MLLAASFLLVSWLSGLCWVFAACYPIVSLIECVFLAIPIGITFGALLGYVASAAIGSITINAIVVAMVIMATGATLILNRNINTIYYRRYLLWGELQLRHSWWVWLVFVASAGLMGFYYDMQTLKEVNGALFSGSSSWGDIGIHLTIMNSFRDGQNSLMSLRAWPVSPIYAGATFAYAFLPDFHSALIATCGTSDRVALLMPSIIVGPGLLTLIALFAYRFCSRSIGAALTATALFVGVGGTGWLYWAVRYEFSVTSILKYGFIERVSDIGSEDINWFAALPHVLLPQRGTAFGYGLLVSILLIVVANDTKDSSVRRSSLSCLLMCGVAAGLMPLVHTHSFLCAFLVLGTFVLASAPSLFHNPLSIGHWFAVAVLTSLLALPQLTLFIGRASEESFIAQDPFWDDDWSNALADYLLDSPKLFLAQIIFIPIASCLRTLGGYPILYLMAYPFLQSATQRKLFLAGLVIFVTASLVRFQPWAKDNIKIFYGWVLIAVATIAGLLRRLWAKSLVVRIVAVLLFVSLVLSGALALYRDAFHFHQFLSAHDVEVGDWALDNMNCTRVAIASNRHNHPISTIAGVTFFRGYDGWLASHGYRYYTYRRELQKRVLEGVPGSLAVIRDFDIGYVIVDSALRKEYNINFAYLGLVAKKMYSAGDFEIYRFLM